MSWVSDTRMPSVVAELLDHATGRSTRRDPVIRSTGGPAGNALLTAWVGVVLLVLFIGELLTLFDVEGLINWHVAIGALLIPPAVAKTGSTGWRIVRYYRGDAGYVAAGPPPLVLRLLGPLVVATTLVLLGTGVVLVLLGQSASDTQLLAVFGFRADWVTLHQAAFIGWAVATGLHVLGRIVPALRLVGGRAARHAHVPGSGWRIAVVALSVMSTIVVAVLLVQDAGSWHSG